MKTERVPVPAPVLVPEFTINLMGLTPTQVDTIAYVLYSAWSDHKYVISRSVVAELYNDLLSVRTYNPGNHRIKG